MRTVIVAWCKSNSIHFEQHIPLKFVGTRNEKLGFKTKIDILFLEGYNLIDKNYKIALKELGYTLHDMNHIFSELEHKYEILNQFGEYEKKCFLRWLVIKKYFLGEPIVHFDGDIVFNECPHTLSEKLNGKTFILQGCPALTVISNPNWFHSYEEHLNLFASDITGYSARAWEKRLEWKDAQKTWTGIRVRQIISSDQDLFRHLLHSNAIYQDELEVIKQGLDNYMLIENPLYLDVYYKNCTPFKYIRIGGIDFLNERKVAFWHMQSDFNKYLCNFMFRKQYLSLLPLSRLELTEQGIEYYFRKFLKKVMSEKKLSRIDTYRYFFEENDFSQLFSCRNWWQKDVFQ